MSKLADVYSEVYEILSILGNDYIDKLPSKLYEHISNERNKENFVQFDVNQPIEKQGIEKDTMNFIAYLNLQYWSDEKEKQKLVKQYTKNDERMQKKLQEKYQLDNLFRKDVEVKKEEITGIELATYRVSIFRKIFNRIKNLFNKSQKKNK